MKSIDENPTGAILCHPEAEIDEFAGTSLPENIFLSGWCNSWGKRLFDLVCASLFLLALLPFMIAACLAVLLSPGPILFVSDRVGRGGKRIRVLKFRTMRPRSETGIHVTRKGDHRITGVGRFLRKWKLDELPQFLNVLRGDMSLIGPRPDTPDFVAVIPRELRPVLLVKPGITSLATLRFRNEEQLLATVPEEQLASYYVDSLLPEKIRIDLDYARHATFTSDLKILIKTVLSIVK